MPENSNQSKSSNYSLNFNGSSYIDAGSASYLNSLSQFSISAWFNLTTAESKKCIVSDWNYNTSPLGHFGLQTQDASGSNYALILFIKATSDVGSNSVKTSAILTENTWYHAVFAYNSGTVTCYINGSPVSLTIIGTIPTTLTNQDGNLLIGDFANLNRFWNGQIDGVSIFNYALSESQAEELYGDSTSGPGDPMALSTPPITYYKLGDNSNLTSGGTLPNFPNLSVEGEVTYSNYSIKFATFDSFGLGNSGIMGGKNAYSISAWFKLDVNADSAIFGNWHGGLDVNYLLRYKVSGGVGIQWYIYSGGATSRLDTNYIPTLGVWTHVVAVKDPITSGGQSRVYINGVQVGTSLNRTALSSPMVNINKEDQLGVYNTGSNFVNGNISNVAYWTDTVLTEPEAEEIYNNGKTIDLNNLTFTAPTHWLPLDERSVYFNGSTLQARDIINNLDGNGVNLREENIVGDAPGSTSNGTGTSIDILDLKGDMNSSSKNAYSINMADYADGTTNPANSGRSTNTP
tara:strand:- start:8 stop:1558 length:1551 start_codon:yes stop_codon:yes gene_type:complete